MSLTLGPAGGASLVLSEVEGDVEDILRRIGLCGEDVLMMDRR